MNDDTPLTQAELVEVLDLYIRPFYDILGGIAAAFVIGAACLIVLGGIRVIWKRVL